jgi:hypothetical protein
MNGQNQPSSAYLKDLPQTHDSLHYRRQPSIFEEILLPILRRDFPVETAQSAFGVFGYGSEVMGMDDAYSSDHHWGIRVNAVMPDALYQARGHTIAQAVMPHLPESFQGYRRARRLLGRHRAVDHRAGELPQGDHRHRPRARSYADWLGAPEEDIIHIVNGELWLDETGRFSPIRTAFQGYYPEPVRLRRIAHWCRYFSGMGSYALKRAILRDNEYYATIVFSRAVRWAVQLAFMLEKQYYPYDKWTYAFSAGCRGSTHRWRRWSMRPCALPPPGNASWNCSTAWPT